MGQKKWRLKKAFRRSGKTYPLEVGAEQILITGRDVIEGDRWGVFDLYLEEVVDPAPGAQAAQDVENAPTKAAIDVIAILDSSAELKDMIGKAAKIVRDLLAVDPVSAQQFDILPDEEPDPVLASPDELVVLDGSPESRAVARELSARVIEETLPDPGPIPPEIIASIEHDVAADPGGDESVVEAGEVVHLDLDKDGTPDLAVVKDPPNETRVAPQSIAALAKRRTRKGKE